MGKRFFFRFNLRRKVILGFVICLAAMGAMASLSFYNLQLIEQKVQLVELADDLSNFILEMRRSEKNYFLYGEGYDGNLQHVAMALGKIDEIQSTGRRLRIEEQLGELRFLLTQYQTLFAAIHAQVPENVNSGQINTLRAKGQALEELSENIVRVERNTIVQINNMLRKILFLSMVLLFLLGLALILYLNSRIIRPLRDIEITTRKIARGNFEPLPVYGSSDEIRRIMQALNRMVVELDRRQEQLVQNRKLSSIGTLSSGIAHQLNNPLNNISTSCQILLEETNADPGLRQRMLSNIDHETIRARDIVRGLLEFSRNKEFALHQENLSRILENSLRLISSQVPAGVDVEMHVPEGLELPMDGQQMQELFLNLFMNGIQAMGDTPGALVVCAEPDRTRGKVAIRVEDTGQGIPKDVLNQIFDPFFTTKEVGSGTGLGLFIVYGIVRKHKGEICVESIKGVGTRFIINLPLNNGAGESGNGSG